MDKKQEIALLLQQALQTQFEIDAPTADELVAMLEIPPDPKLGDFAFPCFRLAKTLRKAPPIIAKALADAWTDEKTADVQCAGGYLNFFLKRESFARELLDTFFAQGAAYGRGDEGAGKTICIDYSSVNIAKRLHVGHLSTTMIGHSLKRIFEFLGYHVVGINHLGDWGTQFGKLISAYKRWGSKEAVEQGGIQALVDLYVRFHDEAERQPELEDEGRAWFKKIETGDSEALALFNWFKDITMLDVQRVYDLLGVTFDSYAGESFYIDKTGRVVEELKEKGLLVVSDGASIVDLEAYNMPPCLILKRDGTTIYHTRDIAAALYRHDTYNFDKCLYVVAYHQDLHFRQLFKVMELMGYPWAKDLVHVSYGMVSYEGEALSTRKGHVVYLEDVLERSMEKALSIIEEKSPGLQDKADVARQVGIGAAVFAFLTNNRIKDVDFWWDRVLNFDGETGPYVQYTHARCCSLLQKARDAGVTPDLAYDASALCDDEAQEVLRLIARFPEVVREAALRYEPSILTRHVTLLAQAYNKYYYEHRILEGEQGAQAARVRLTTVVRDMIKTELYLIGMEAPVRM